MGQEVSRPSGKPGTPEWHAEAVRNLRYQLRLTQREMAQHLGVRQQTVSDWETGVYAPRGASRRVLSMVAEQAARYATGPAMGVAEQAARYTAQPDASEDAQGRTGKPTSSVSRSRRPVRRRRRAGRP